MSARVATTGRAAMDVRLSLDGRDVLVRLGAWSDRFPVARLGHWIALYRGLRDRRAGRFAKFYAADVAALEALAAQLGMPAGAGEGGGAGEAVAPPAQNPHGGAGTAGATVRQTTEPRAVPAGAVDRHRSAAGTSPVRASAGPGRRKRSPGTSLPVSPGAGTLPGLFDGVGE